MGPHHSMPVPRTLISGVRSPGQLGWSIRFPPHDGSAPDPSGMRNVRAPASLIHVVVLDAQRPVPHVMQASTTSPAGKWAGWTSPSRMCPNGGPGGSAQQGFAEADGVVCTRTPEDPSIRFVFLQVSSHGSRVERCLPSRCRKRRAGDAIRTVWNACRAVGGHAYRMVSVLRDAGPL